MKASNYRRYTGLDRVFIGLFVLLIVTNGLLSNDYSYIKTASLILLFGFSLFEILIHKVIVKSLVLFGLAFMVFVAISILIGISNGYGWEAANLRLLRYYVLFPLAFIVIGHSFLYRTHKMYQYIRILTISTFLLLIFCIGEQFYMAKYIPVWPFHNLINVEGIIVNSNQTTIQIACETIFAFLIPFFTFRFFDRKNSTLVTKIIVLMFGVYILLSERKILVLIFGLSIIFSIIWWLGTVIKRLKVKKKFVYKYSQMALFVIALGLIIAMIVFVLKKIDISDLYDQLVNHLTSGLESENEGIMKRTRHISKFIDGIGDNLSTILFGHGLQSYLIGDLANFTEKWDYEVFYAAWIYQTGIAGVLMLVFVVLYYSVHLISAYMTTKNNNYLFVLFAFMMSLISAGTNPSINEYWFFLLPMCFMFEYKIKCSDLIFIDNNKFIEYNERRKIIESRVLQGGN